MRGFFGRAMQVALNKSGYQFERVRDAFLVQRGCISRRDPTIFDVGANVGSVTRRYRQVFPDAVIYAFEPFPDSYRTLARAFERDPRVRCQELALADTIGMALLNSNLCAETNSLLPTAAGGSTYWGAGVLDTVQRVEVPTTTIDAFMTEHGIGSIDILKLDVQGAEYAVLRGASSALSHGAVGLVYMEIIMTRTYEGQHRLQDYLLLMDSFNYSLLDVFNETRCGPQLIQLDTLFVRSTPASA